MENLPDDITSNILLRLPFKSIGQGRCVSKLWCSILSNDESLKQLRENMLLFYTVTMTVAELETYRPRIVCLEDNVETFNQTPIKLIKKFDFDLIYGIICVLGSCNGFFCVAPARGVFLSNPIYVFNPITKEHVKLPYFEFQQHDPTLPERYWGEYDDRRRIDFGLFGFGFDDTTKKFKLVIAIFSGWDLYGNMYLGNELQVHTLGTTTWTKKVGIVPDRLSKYLNKTVEVVNNGCLHWITWDLLIVSFNLSVEEFGIVPFPESLLLEFDYKYVRDLSLALVEECLSIAECSLERGIINIWVMKTYNVHESWVKQYSVELGGVSHHLSQFYCIKFMKFRSNGEILIVCNRMVKADCLFSYDVTSQEFTLLKVDWVDEGDFFETLPFVGSLISLKSACGIEKNTET